MKKQFNHIFYILFTLIVSGSGFAQGQSLGQLLGDRQSGSTDSLVIKAISPSLSVIRQQYRLKRNNEFFGKNNMPYYGETFSLGVKVSGGTIFQNSVVTPWVGDADYERVNKDGKYQPILFWSKQRELNDSIFTPVELELNTQYTRPVGNDSLLYLHRDIYSDFGLSIRSKADKHSGYMIWAYANPSVQDSSMTVNIKFRPLSLDMEEGIDNFKMTPDNPENIIGGIFVEPLFERSGRIQLALVGVAAKDSDNNWTLFIVTEENLQGSKAKGKDKTIEKNKSKREKSKPSDADPTPIKSSK